MLRPLLKHLIKQEMKTCIAAFVIEIMWMCVCCRRYIIMWCSCSSMLYFLLDISVVASCFDGRHSGFGAGAGSGGLGTAEGSDGVSPGSTGLRKKKNQVMLSSWIYLLWYKKKKLLAWSRPLIHWVTIIFVHCGAAGLRAQWGRAGWLFASITGLPLQVVLYLLLHRWKKLL